MRLILPSCRAPKRAETKHRFEEQRLSQSPYLFLLVKDNQLLRNRTIGATQHRPEVSSNQSQAAQAEGGLKHLIAGAKDFPQGMIANHVVFDSVFELRTECLLLGCAQLAMVEADLLGMGSRLPASHP